MHTDNEFGHKHKHLRGACRSWPVVLYGRSCVLTPGPISASSRRLDLGNTISVTFKLLSEIGSEIQTLDVKRHHETICEQQFYVQ